MNKAQIIALQQRIGAEPDGFFGRDSIGAVQKHLARLMPSPHPWPSASEAALVKFYGQPGDESNLVSIPAPKGLLLYGEKQVTSVRCHKRVAESLARILPQVVEHLQCYDGCFNFRRMRGGTSWSTHSWGIAIDLDAANNGNSTHWPSRASMPVEVMEIFAREGWLPAGAFWGRDAMHFQATR